MADHHLLETGDFHLLESGGGDKLLLESAPLIRVQNDGVHVTEQTNRKRGLIRVRTETVDVQEGRIPVKSNLIVRVRNETVNVSEAKNNTVTRPTTNLITRGRVERFDILPSWGGQPIGALFPEDMDSGTIDRGTNATTRLTLAIPSAQGTRWSTVLPGRVLRAMFVASNNQRSWQEFLVQECGDVQRTGVNTVTGVGFLGALAEIGYIEQVDADGTALATFAAPGLTPREHIATYYIGLATAKGYTNVEVGRVEFTAPIDVTYDKDDIYSAGLKLASAVGGEIRERWNPATSKYAIDLVAAIGDPASNPDGAGPFGEARAYVTAEIDRTRTRLTQSTVVYPTGNENANCGDADWQISAITPGSGTTGTIALIDPLGGAGPIGVANQFVQFTQLGGATVSAGYLRSKSGVLTKITASNVSADTVTVLDRTAFTVGDLVSIRADSTGRKVTELLHPAAVTSYGRVKEGLQLPNIPSTVNLVPNPVGRIWTGATTVPPDLWLVVASATITKTGTAPYLQDGPYSIKVATLDDGDGISTPLIPLYPTAIAPFGSAYFNFYLSAGAGRVELVLTDGVTSWVLPPTGSAKASATRQGVFDQLGINGINLYESGATAARLRFVQDGPTPMVAYISAAQMTNSAGFLPFFEGNGPRQLHQAANVEVAIKGPLQVRYTMTLDDLARLLIDGYESLRCVLGAKIRVINDTLGIYDAVRIIQMVEDVKVEANTKLTLSDRPQDMATLLTLPKPNPHQQSNAISTAVEINAAKYVDDLVITNAIVNASSATAAFTDADVGKTLWIFGGMSTLGILKTTIASVTSGTTITLGTAAGRSATGLTAIYGGAADVLTLAGGIGGTRAGNALSDNSGKLVPGATDATGRTVEDFFHKPSDTLDAIGDGSIYVKRLPLCDLTVTEPSATGTTVTIAVSATVGNITITPSGGVTNNFDGTYTIARNPAGVGPLLYTVTSALAGHESVSKVVMIPEQSASGGGAAGGSLVVTTSPGANSYTIVWSGVGTLTLAIDGGGYGAPPVSPIVVTRNPIGGLDKIYSFQSVGADGTIMTDTVVVPAKASSVTTDSNTVTPDLAVVPTTQTDTQSTFTQSVTDPTGLHIPSITITVYGTTGVARGDGFNMADTALPAGTPLTLTVPSWCIGVTVNRPPFGSAPAQLKMRASLAAFGGGFEEIVITITAQNPLTSPNLTVTPGTPSGGYAPATHAKFTPVAADPNAIAVPVVRLLLHGTTAIGTVTGPIPDNTTMVLTSGEDIEILRPPYGSAPATAIFTATLANGVVVTVQRTVSAQDKAAAPSMIITTTPGDSSYSIAYSGVVGTLTVSTDGGSYSSPVSSPIVVTRTTSDHTRTFQCVGADGTVMTQTVTIPSLIPPPTPTVSVNWLSTNTGTDTMQFGISGANWPAGYTIDLLWKGPNESSFTTITGISLTSGHYDLTGTGYDFQAKNPGVNYETSISIIINIKSGATVVATNSSDGGFWWDGSV